MRSLRPLALLRALAVGSVVAVMGTGALARPAGAVAGQVDPTSPPVELEPPISLTATEVAPGDQTPLIIDDAQLSGGKRLGEWFGAPIQRTLILTLHNRSAEELDEVVISVSAGAAGTAPRSIPVPEVGPLAADGTVIVRVPIELPIGAAGSYRVQAKASASSLPTTAAVEVTTHPWGLIVLLFGAVALLLVRLVRLRRRIGRQPSTEAESDPSPEPEPALLEAP